MSFKIILSSFISVFLMSTSVSAQEVCNARNLSGLLDVDLNDLNEKKLDISIGRSMGGTDVKAYYLGDRLMVIKAFFKGAGGMANMNYYFMENKQQNHLMEYINDQYSDYLDQESSVLLTREQSYYHVCNGELVEPAFQGVVSNDTYQNMKLVLDVILTEEAAQ